MKLQPLKFRPGANRDATRFSNEGTWWDMDKVRFFNGYPQKIGGWVQLGTGTFNGVCRFMHNWASLTGEDLLAVGTNTKMYIERGGLLNDITPTRVTLAATNPFATTIGLTSVVVNIVGHGALTGDFVTFTGAAAIGGVPAGELNIAHQVVVTTLDAFTITVVTAATSTVAAGGGAVSAAFQPNTGAPVGITGGGYGGGTYGTSGYGTFVTPQYGQYVGDNFGEDLIFAIRDGGMYYWSAAGIPASLAVRGVPLETIAGASSAPLVADNVLVTSDEHVVAVGTDAISKISVLTNALTSGAAASPIVTLTMPLHGLATGGAVTLTDAVTFDGLVAAELNAQHIVTFVDVDTVTFTVTTGCTAGAVAGGGTITVYAQDGAEDPLLVRWCAQGNPLNWTPQVINTAGDYRLTAGSYTYAAKRMRQENLIWTDTALYSMQFVGPPVVFSFIQLADNISIASATAVAVVDNVAYWMGTDRFYTYNGQVQSLPCEVRKLVFGDFSATQQFQVYAGTNVAFSEITWLYCTTNALSPDRYVTYNYQEKVWSFGTMTRTAWLDAPLRTVPVAAGVDNKLYYHETGMDDGSTAPVTAINAYVESADFDLSEGDDFMFVERIIPDVDFSGSSAANPTAVMTLKARNFPGSNFAQTNNRSVAQTAVLPFNQFTDQMWTRLRGRQMAFRIESTATGVTWQLGVPRIGAREDGQR